MKRESGKPIAIAKETPAAHAWGPSVALALVAAALTYIRYRWLDVPLDRDEGEFAYIAQQMLRGVPPYASGYAMKMPGIYAIYALAMSCFGQSTRGIHLGLLVADLLSLLLVFLIARRLFNAWTGLCAAALFGLLAVDVSLQGSTAQAEHFVLVPALLGIWLLIVGPSGKRPGLTLVVAGFCLGTATMIKQHAAPLALFAIGWVAVAWWQAQPRHWRKLMRDLALLAVGGLLPLGIVMLWMAAAGVFEPFWFWTITYARVYAGGTTLAEGSKLLLAGSNRVFRSQPLVWGLSLLGLVALAVDGPFRLEDKVCRQRGFLFAWLLFSFLCTCPSLHFFPHAFVLMLPVVAILAALGCQTLATWIVRGLRLVPTRQSAVIAGVTASVVAISVFFQSGYLFRADPIRVSRMTYGFSPFPEAVKIADYIQSHSRETGPIAVLGSEPQLYF